MIYDGALETLRERYGTSRMLVVDFTEPIAAVDVAPAEVVQIDGPRQWLRFHRDAVTASDLIGQIAQRYPVLDLTIEEPAVEDIVRNIYTGGIALDSSPAATPASDATPSASGDQPASSP